MDASITLSTEAPNYTIQVQSGGTSHKMQTVVAAVLFTTGVVLVIASTATALILRRRYMNRQAKDKEERVAAGKASEETQWSV